MRALRMNIVKMTYSRMLLARLGPTGRQCRLVRGELRLVRIGPGCLVPVVVAEGPAGR
ncbi:MAG: hypothetical protein JW753_11705 [Dehalococcoidia bacterium]|nr:hypothetical protein [Dehalococcoidia bacterium]